MLRVRLIYFWKKSASVLLCTQLLKTSGRGRCFWSYMSYRFIQTNGDIIHNMDFPYLVKWTCIKYYQTESVPQNTSNNFLQNSLQEVNLKPPQPPFGEKRMIKWGPRGASQQKDSCNKHTGNWGEQSSRGCCSDNPILKHYMSWPADTLLISKVGLILFPWKVRLLFTNKFPAIPFSQPVSQSTCNRNPLK